MKIIGLRKFVLGVLTLASFTSIQLKVEDMDPFNLGLGLGALMLPIILGNGVSKVAEAWKSRAGSASTE